MEASIESTKIKSVLRDAADLSCLDSSSNTDDSSVVSSCKETTASIDPDVLVVSSCVNEVWSLLSCLGLCEVVHILKVHVLLHCCHFVYLLLYYKLEIMIIEVLTLGM